MVYFTAMLLPQLLAIALAPALVSAALFPKDTKVKQLDAKGFRKMMKQNVSPDAFFVQYTILTTA